MSEKIFVLILTVFLNTNLVLAESLCLKDGFLNESIVIETNSICLKSLSIITKARASELFKELSSISGVPYGYVIDGCNARAMAMTYEAEQKHSINMAKVFIKGALQVNFGLEGRLNYGRYDWHVAPVVLVSNEDSVEAMVIDPVLFDTPTSIDEWKTSMLYPTDDDVKSRFLYKGPFTPSIDEVYFGARFQFDPREFEDYKNEWSDTDLIDMNYMLEFFQKKLDRHLRRTESLLKKTN